MIEDSIHHVTEVLRLDSHFRSQLGHKVVLKELQTCFEPGHFYGYIYSAISALLSLRQKKIVSLYIIQC